MHYIIDILDELNNLYVSDVHGFWAAFFSFTFNVIGLPYQAYLNWRSKSVRGFGAPAAFFGTIQALEMTRHELDGHFDPIVFFGSTTGLIAGIILCIQFFQYAWKPRLILLINSLSFWARRKVSF